MLLGGALVVLGCFLFLMAAGLLTRGAGRAFPALYGFHAVLVAPLYVFLFSVVTARTRGVVELTIAVALFALVLGAMSPTMLWGIALAYLIALAVYGATRGSRFAGAVVFGAAAYPVFVGLGFATHAIQLSSLTTLDTLARYALLVLVTVLLSLAGALLSRYLERRLSR